MLIKKYILLTGVTTLFLSSLGIAHAGVTIYSDNISLQSNQMNAKQYFAQSGLSIEDAKVVKGGAANMGLALASKLIIPDDWKTNLTGDYQNASINWVGDISWSQILRNIAQENKIYINIDWIKKIVNINVPESYKTSQKQASKVAKNSETKLKDFSLKQKKKWQKRKDLESDISSKDKQIQELIAAQRNAEKANGKHISELLSKIEESKKEANTLRMNLHNEIQEKQAIIDKYAVLDPSHQLPKNIDAIEMHKKYKAAWVLPFDSSFDYYLKGGFSDPLAYTTPATYLAKSGTIESVIKHWADAVGWEVEYRSKVEHYNPYTAEYKGNFIDVSKSLLTIFLKSKRPLNIEFFDNIINSKGTKGLVIISDYNFKK